MQRISDRKVWLAMLAAAALGLLAIVAFTGSASARHHGHKKGGNAKIKMVKDGKKLAFSGDKTVKAGKKIQVINKTNPKRVGPHTFTLVKKAAMPRTKKQQKKCENLKLKVCKTVFKAHKVGPPPDFPIGKPTVDVGKKGWDKSFTKTKKGDSWVSQKKNESQSRTVRAKAGQTLYFFCDVHPWMTGKIKVVK